MSLRCASRTASSCGVRPSSTSSCSSSAIRIAISTASFTRSSASCNRSSWQSRCALSISTDTSVTTWPICSKIAFIAFSRSARSSSAMHRAPSLHSDASIRVWVATLRDTSIIACFCNWSARCLRSMRAISRCAAISEACNFCCASSSVRCRFFADASSSAARWSAAASSARSFSAASAASCWACRAKVTVCHMVTATATNTTAPKNHSALLPSSPGAARMYHAMVRVPATPQTSQPIPVLASKDPPLRSGLASVAVTGIGAVRATASSSEIPVALADSDLVDSLSSVMLNSHRPRVRPCRVQIMATPRVRHHRSPSAGPER
ncbi:hypothetical protein MSMEI_1594 [Mycolicibacterium smegmatis MC2 155]|uniref:Uncharacterized protein n=1 Tax=Mycolicibacterium smegmatis (strain ATCC 700084 / mc(2)155) TaxID=246196 RepID=I7FYI3_MYCS2|nr:hypothetical protein MSMEI_1594 [Mycolicibacterium smegmatis MC2 155]